MRRNRAKINRRSGRYLHYGFHGNHPNNIISSNNYPQQDLPTIELELCPQFPPMMPNEHATYFQAKTIGVHVFICVCACAHSAQPDLRLTAPRTEAQPTTSDVLPRHRSARGHNTRRHVAVPHHATVAASVFTRVAMSPVHVPHTQRVHDTRDRRHSYDARLATSQAAHDAHVSHHHSTPRGKHDTCIPRSQ